MFFPLDFWLRLGEAACEPSRKRARLHPLPEISQAELIELVGPTLAEPFVPRPDARDAYRQAAKAALSIYDPGYLLPREDDPAFMRAAAEQIQKCRPAADEIKRLLEQTEWQFPATPEVEMEFPELPALKHLNLMMQLHARMLWRLGDFDGALADYRTAFTLASRIRGCGGLFIHELVGSACVMVTVRSIRAGLASRANADSLLKELDTVLAGAQGPQDRLPEAFDREFRLGIIPTARLRGHPGRPRSVNSSNPGVADRYRAQELLVEWALRNHPNPVDRRQRLRDIRRCYEEVAAVVGRGCERVEALDRLGNEFSEGVPEAFRPALFDTMFGVPPTTVLSASISLRRTQNPYGRLQMMRVLKLSADLVTAAYRCHADVLATRICIAAARSRLCGAAGPVRSLDSLVTAGFLDAIPEDPIRGGPFQLDVGAQKLRLPGLPKPTFIKVLGTTKGADEPLEWPLPPGE